MVQGVLFDYTTLVSATNALNCGEAFYPLSVRNPYEELLRGQPTPSASPMWLELGSLAEAVEAAVLHEKLYILPVVQRDRVLRTGRYSSPTSGNRLLGQWIDAGIVEFLPDSQQRFDSVEKWLACAAGSANFIDALVESMFRLLKEPVYAAIPDLFSHSQTVYTFDGESVWELFSSRLPSAKEFGQRVDEVWQRLDLEPLQMNYTPFFYFEQIAAFLIRGLVYNLIAGLEGVPYHPHPARSAVALTDGLWSLDLTTDYALLPMNFVRNLRDEIAKMVNERQDADVFELGLPPIFTAILREANNPSDIVRLAMQFRDTNPARQYRDWIQTSYAANRGLDAIHAQRELDTLRAKLRLELGLDEKTVNVGLWKFSYDVKLPRWLFKSFYVGSRRRYQFIRDVAKLSLDVMKREPELIRIFRSVKLS